MLEKNSRLISRSETKESNKNHILYKTALVRETKASRLRAASIISPNGKLHFIVILNQYNLIYIYIYIYVCVCVCVLCRWNSVVKKIGYVRKFYTFGPPT